MELDYKKTRIELEVGEKTLSLPAFRIKLKFLQPAGKVGIFDSDKTYNFYLNKGKDLKTEFNAIMHAKNRYLESSSILTIYDNRVGAKFSTLFEWIRRVETNTSGAVINVWYQQVFDNYAANNEAIKIFNSKNLKAS